MYKDSNNVNRDYLACLKPFEYKSTYKPSGQINQYGSAAPNPLHCAVTLHSVHQVQTQLQPFVGIHRESKQRIQTQEELWPKLTSRMIFQWQFLRLRNKLSVLLQIVYTFSKNTNQMIPQYLRLKSKLFGRSYLYENKLRVLFSFISMY